MTSPRYCTSSVCTGPPSRSFGRPWTCNEVLGAQHPSTLAVRHELADLLATGGRRAR